MKKFDKLGRLILGSQADLENALYNRRIDLREYNEMECESCTPSHALLEVTATNKSYEEVHCVVKFPWGLHDEVPVLVFENLMQELPARLHEVLDGGGGVLIVELIKVEHRVVVNYAPPDWVVKCN